MTNVSCCVENSNNNHNNNSPRSPRRSVSRVAEKYSLRPRTLARRLQDVDRKREGLSRRSSTESPYKSRPPPLSKYRRKTANARERHRMKEINDAFEALRRTLPDFCSSRRATATATTAAMTKIATLRLAVRYIRALSHILQEGGHPGDISFFDHLSLDAHSMNASQMASSKGANSIPPQLHASSPDTSPLSSSSSPSASRNFSSVSCSFGSSDDINDFLQSDDSCCVFDDNLDAFSDIQSLPETDPYSLLLAPDGEVFLFS